MLPAIQATFGAGEEAMGKVVTQTTAVEIHDAFVLD